MSARRILIILGFVVAWLGATGVLGQKHLDRARESHLRAELRQAGLLADTIAAEIGREFARLRSLTKILTRSEQIRATIPFVGYRDIPDDEAARIQRQAELRGRMDLIEVNEMLAATADDLGLRRIRLLHRSGEVIASSRSARGEDDIGSVLSGDRLHAAASIVGSAEGFHVDADNVPGYRFASAIEIDGDVIGVLVVEQSSFRIARPLNSHRQKIFITDENGVAVIARETALLMAAAPDARVHSITNGERLFRYGQRAVARLPFQYPEGADSDTLIRSADGTGHASVIRSFPSEPLWVNVYTPLAGLEALRRATLFRIALIALVGLLVMLVIERTVAFALSTRAKNAQLRAANRQVEEAMEARSRFFALMSHEIRTPMTGVLGMLEQLGLSRLDTDQAWLLRTVRNSAESLITIINDILDFSKIEAGRLDLEFLEVDITDILEAVAHSMAPVAAERDVILYVRIDSSVRAPYRVDPTRLRQVLFNFTTNAVKFAEGGRVGLSVERTVMPEGPDMIRFAVSDTGIGMDTETTERLFAPFTQADESTTRRFGGTGLGLSICKSLAEMMDGTISVESEPGVGSVFILELPLTPVAGALIVAPPADFFIGHRIFIRGGGPDLDDAILENLSGTKRASEIDAADLIISLDDGDPPGPSKPHLRLVMAPGQGLPSWLHRNAVAAAAADALGLDASAFRPRTADDVASHPLMSREDALASGKLVLVADDHPVNREVLRRHIESLGYPVDLVGDGEMAWERLSRTAYGILLTDLHMPRLDGLELARRIRALEAERGTERLPVIAITASILTGEFDQCRRAGADDVLLKPLLRKDLAVLLEQWIGPSSGSPAPAGEAGAALGDNPAVIKNGATGLDGTAPVDLTILTELMGDDPGMISFAFTEYLETTPPDLAELAGAVSALDFARMRDCAHRLKGACNMIGALAAGDLAHELEKRSFAGDLACHEDLPAEVARAVEAALGFIRDWLAVNGSQTLEAG
jgi:signal transduction histidine kinase/HPt (histidine-containing phosphotransfer) domain-containing protein/ActR/RegA family two-component response regulator